MKEMQKNDGMNYAPKGKPNPVVKPVEFMIAAVALDHGHIYGMVNGLIEAGDTLKWVYDRDRAKAEAFARTYPQVTIAASEEEILADPQVQLGAGRLQLLKRCKGSFIRKIIFACVHHPETERTAERLHVESAVYAGQLIEQGAIGRVLQVTGFGPHRLNASSRPEWFFQKKQYGGILCDIGSHQVEQFLFYAGCKQAEVLHSKVANYNNPEYPELEDFGDATLLGDNGATQYFRVDWFTPDGLGSWGDGRTLILGTEGYIELRKYIDIARDRTGNHVYLVNQDGEYHFHVDGQVGYPFFGELILDCLNRTENAMTQEHAFMAAELCLKAQEMALDVTRGGS
ncbi:hypothetical protein BGX30_011755 [Mortierella sp. GBA39]|nr:hypothetical protein BGX30_011755 [Mortierella sp. GBA39]